MKKTLFLLLFLCCTATLFSQRKEYSSRVYDGITYTPVEGANVYNFSSKKFAFTDEEGFFSIDVQANDTLLISKSIYRQSIVILTQYEIENRIDEYLLFYKAVLLREVNVHSLNPDYESFKRDLARVQLSDIYKQLDGIEPTDWDRMNMEYAEKGANILRNTPLASPITYFYNMFSKKVKAKKLYYEMLEYEDELHKLPQKYSREVVSEITGLTGDDLMEFMVFCRFSYYDLIRWSEEQIVRNIQSKFYDYEYYKAISDE
ncbi:carboxypeptidase-like regulatory domain-containing protein [Bacteroidales bacterium OttesenSCG-928-L19]|nr:carboxypeptidase-like regulatory domain-containing protein [Bacteroidales bacterium OttesenSCG-928-L19]